MYKNIIWGLYLMNVVKKLVAVSALALAFPSASFAQGDQLNPWTECGLGAMVFSSTPWAAALSNVIWDAGTTAVTSAGTSKHTCEGKKVAAARFITETYASLEEETAKGGGQHVAAVLNIMGCNAASHGSIIRSVRADLASSMKDTAYAEKTTTEKAQGYYSIVQDQVDGQFSKQCQVI